MEKTEFRAFNIAMPEPLIPIYDFLQSELNSILRNDIYRTQLKALDLTKHRGNISRDMKNIFTNRVQEWSINNRAWYARILYENIRRELQSKEDNIKIWNEYLLNDKQITQVLFTNLATKYNIYATRGRVKSIVDGNRVPELAREAVFQLDYTISEKQMFRVNKNNPYLFEIKVGNKPTDWIGYLVHIPKSINQNFTGKITKPRFIKRKSDGNYIGICSYEVEVDEISKENTAILGVDIGRINLYSAIVINNEIISSPQLLPSRKLCKLNEKLKRLTNEREFLYLKNKRFEQYKVESLKQDRRITNYFELRHKISNLTTQMANLVAYEIVELAKEYKCKEIHIENLAWLESQGRKWNHSEVFTKIEEVASVAGIKVIRVNACNSSRENPITKEVGIIDNRKIKFIDGTYIDRDLLASINLASRNKKNKVNQKVKELNIPQRKRTRLTKSRKQEILNRIKNKRDVEIVAFHPCQATILDEATWKDLMVQTVYTSCLTKGSFVSNRYKNYHLRQV